MADLIGDDPTIEQPGELADDANPDSLNLIRCVLDNPDTARRDRAALCAFKDVLRGLVLAYGQSVFGLKRIVAITSPDNDRSAQLLEKLGFTFEKMVQLPNDSEAARFNADPEIQALLAEIKADDGSMNQFFGPYSTGKAASLNAHEFDRLALGKRG